MPQYAPKTWNRGDTITAAKLNDIEQAAAAAAVKADTDAALAGKADLAGGAVPDAQLPVRLSDASLKAAYVALGQLAASPDLMVVGTITRSANGAATGFGVVWPDGATGVFAGTESTTAPGAIDSYTVTHVAGGTTVTYTQPALTRDGNGAVTTRPAMTVA